ncbi:phage tail sheath C-terminal domain-containing protein [Nocardioides sp.]|uniref:phage tail sheath C-terminal domain-containing protein n=1 Tax=Nocardioides sp. TaxID=35761 RepID=UPI002BDD0666|nr:phage tail sheath C-terminal domain-containing protein [Nocardioides sp.]HXH78136.1 phage tail sheath C-terminal domain-containing protein [Nocardioides sp.]
MTTVLPDLDGSPTGALTFRGRLPGVACDPALPAAEEPVRLDVAAFVGFAAKGPLHTPIAVADATQFAAVFGGDLALAQEQRTPVQAQLPSAVRAFFDNGGRRCHVVRVAGPAAVPGRWQVPGLQVWQADGTTKDAVVESAWPGAWSVGTTVRAELLTRALPVVGNYTRRTAELPGLLPVGRLATASVQAGDLLRLDASSAGLYVRVLAVDAGAGTVSTDFEVTFDLSDPTVPQPALLALLPDDVALDEVRLHRLCLVVGHGHVDESRVLAKDDDLAFGDASVPTTLAIRPSWSGILQPAGDGGPDLTRSQFLRQDADTTTALANGVAVPVAMAQAASVAPPDDDLPAPLQVGTDDLDTFDPAADWAWFLEPELATDTVFSLVPHAEQLTVLSHTPRRLRGIHALVGIDEVAMISVPDALNRGWIPFAAPPPPEPPPEPEQEPENWSDFHCCSDNRPEPVAEEPPEPPTPVDLLPMLDPVASYDDAGLRSIQAALVVLCAATADRVAILSVPKHFDVVDTLAWRARLSAESRIADGNNTGTSPLGYAAYWHPWVSVVTDQQGTRSVLRDVAPDGAAAGMVAARELARGAWLAPAGIPLRGVVRLASPQPLSEQDQKRLFDAHANLFTQHPGTFTALSAHTMTGDPQVLQLSVRRLLILLRKICLRLGVRYTFEINNDRFRQLVRMRFDRILNALVQRGAIHGFRVEVAGGVNTPEDQDAGRFIVVLRIAPTSPIEFITVTLVRTGEGLLDVLEG